MSDVDNNFTKFNEKFNEKCKRFNKTFNKKFQLMLFINNIARIA